MKDSLIYLILLLPNIKGGTFSDVVSLYNDLTLGHNAHLRPEINQSLVTQISTKFNLISLRNIDAVEGTISISGFFTVNWSDKTLVWDPSNYGNTEKVTFPIDTIWKPPLLISNSVTSLKLVGMKDSYIKVGNSGFITWEPSESITFACSIDSSYFPFDIQTCSFLLRVSGFDIFEVQLVKEFPTMDITSYQENGEWELLSTNVREKDWGGMKFEMQFKRRPMFFIISIVLPVMFIALLNILVFVLPQETGERMGFAITSLLSIIVFLTIAQELLPATALPRLSAICVTLTVDMFMSGSIIVSTVVSSWLYHRSTKIPVPRWIKQLLLLRFKENQVSVVVRADNQLSPFTMDTKQSMASGKHTRKITWCEVSAFWDKLSIGFYTFWFFVSVLAFIIDILLGLV